MVLATILERLTMQSEMEIAGLVKAIIVDNKTEEMSLLDIVKKAVPRLSEDSIKKFFAFIVDGKRIDDWSFKVSPQNKVEVLPMFAGGSI